MYARTAEPPHSDTYTKRPSADAIVAYGSDGSWTVLVTTPLATSIVDSVIANSRVTNSVRPSPEIESPPANVSPLIDGSAKVRSRVITPSANANSWTLFCPAPDE